MNQEEINSYENFSEGSPQEMVYNLQFTFYAKR